MAGEAYPKSAQTARSPKAVAKAQRRRRAPRRSHGNTVPKDVLEELWRRCGGNCEARTRACTGQAEHPHHRKTKGSHGPDHSLANLLAVCRECHSHIHAWVAESLSFGWLLPSWADPEEEP